MGVPISSRSSRTAALQIVCAVVGVLVVLVGAADVTSRIARGAFGPNALFEAFAPAVAINNPLFVQNAPSALSITVASTTPIIPARLVIPVIGVNANVEQVGNNAAGSMGTPRTFGDVAWYMLGPKPGDPGNAVIDGHVNNALTTTGVFEHLSQLKPGDKIMLSDTSGNTLTYTVTSTVDYGTNNAPVASIFSNTGPSQLVLVTCDGTWVQSQHSFNERLVVYASLSAQ